MLGFFRKVLLLFRADLTDMQEEYDVYKETRKLSRGQELKELRLERLYMRYLEAEFKEHFANKKKTVDYVG